MCLHSSSITRRPSSFPSNPIKGFKLKPLCSESWVAGSAVQQGVVTALSVERAKNEKDEASNKEIDAPEHPTRGFQSRLAQSKGSGKLNSKLRECRSTSPGILRILKIQSASQHSNVFFPSWKSAVTVSTNSSQPAKTFPIKRARGRLGDTAEEHVRLL